MKKKEDPEKTFLKCPSCKISLDGGNESIIWKCSCGTINMGRLMDFEEVENYPESNLVKCPECGREFDDSLMQCPNCGCHINNSDKSQSALNKQKVIDYLKSLQVFFRILIAIFVIITIVFFYKAYDVKHNYRNTDYTILNENAYVGGDAYNYIINGTYFTAYSVIGSIGMLCATIFSVSAIWISIKIRERINTGG